MFKKILAVVLSLSILAPSVALAGDGRHGHGRHYDYRGHHHNSDRWVGPLIGGIILGGILSQRPSPPPVVYNYPQPRYEPYYPPVQYYCRDILVTSRDSWGNPYQYYVRQCD